MKIKNEITIKELNKIFFNYYQKIDWKDLSKKDKIYRLFFKEIIIYIELKNMGQAIWGGVSPEDVFKNNEWDEKFISEINFWNNIEKFINYISIENLPKEYMKDYYIKIISDFNKYKSLLLNNNCLISNIIQWNNKEYNNFFSFLNNLNKINFYIEYFIDKKLTIIKNLDNYILIKHIIFLMVYTNKLKESKRKFDYKKSLKIGHTWKNNNFSIEKDPFPRINDPNINKLININIKNNGGSRIDDLKKYLINIYIIAMLKNNNEWDEETDKFLKRNYNGWVKEIYISEIKEFNYSKLVKEHKNVCQNYSFNINDSCYNCKNKIKNNCKYNKNKICNYFCSAICNDEYVNKKSKYFLNFTALIYNKKEETYIHNSFSINILINQDVYKYIKKWNMEYQSNKIKKETDNCIACNYKINLNIFCSCHYYCGKDNCYKWDNKNNRKCYCSYSKCEKFLGINKYYPSFCNDVCKNNHYNKYMPKILNFK